MRYLLNNSTDPYFNMALDEFCLENIVLDEPYFYLWRNRPSVIIGLNQNAYSEVNLKYLEDNGILLVRRVTGGGAVYHDLNNLNYTIIGAVSPHPERSEGSSPVPVVSALRKLGVPAELTGRNDIFVECKKVSGYARRVCADRQIIHGTLMYDVDLDTLTKALDTPGSKMRAKGIGSVRSRVANLKEYLPGFRSLDSFQSALQDILSDGDEQIRLSADHLDKVVQMAREKFATWDFIYGRSRQAGFVRQAKLPCGNIEASIILDRGLVTDISFCGDFLFSEPADALAAKLIGCRLERKALLEALSGIDVQKYLPGVGADDLVRLICY